ncbi:MAG: hypothetical protein M3Q13_04130 [Pseudomonadota bacterium]|nr:hypothetical protein [Pseudomonadota bacterium]
MLTYAIVAVIVLAWAVLLALFLARNGSTKALRLIGAAVCAVTTSAGLGIVWFGVTIFGDTFTTLPTRDRAYGILFGSVVCLIGLVTAGFSIRWFINAIRPKRSVATDVERIKGDITE